MDSDGANININQDEVLLDRVFFYKNLTKNWDALGVQVIDKVLSNDAGDIQTKKKYLTTKDKFSYTMKHIIAKKFHQWLLNIRMTIR